MLRRGRLRRDKLTVASEGRGRLFAIDTYGRAALAEGCELVMWNHRSRWSKTAATATVDSLTFVMQQPTTANHCQPLPASRPTQTNPPHSFFAYGCCGASSQDGGMRSEAVPVVRWVQSKSSAARPVVRSGNVTCEGPR